MNDYKLSEGKILDRSKLAKYEHLVKIPEKKVWPLTRTMFFLRKQPHTTFLKIAFSISEIDTLKCFLLGVHNYCYPSASFKNDAELTWCWYISHHPV